MNNRDILDKEFAKLNFGKGQPFAELLNTYKGIASKLRMKNGMNGYTQVLHRMFYVTIPPDNTLWLALCLYNPLSFDIPAKCMIINSVNGQMTEIDKQDSGKILSAREKQVLNLIDRGLTSKEVATTLYISTNTVTVTVKRFWANSM